MKKIYNLALGLGISAMCIGFTSCSDVLDEQPRTDYDPTFFQTEEGIEGGLTSLYAHLRYIYGQAYYYNICETGTDEYTYGKSADGNFKDADLVPGTSSLTSSSSRSDVLWSAAFPNINTASGVIENGEAANMNAALIAEAYFFRAFDYFQLVQTFGGVPLDLGAGELKFNTSPVRTSKRNTVPEVYKAIFSDFNTAIKNLPDQPRVTGGVTKTTARFFLAKAYLTFGWWLENPQSIPTYPECDRVCLDGHDKAWYFQQALALAETVFAEEKAGTHPYGLMEYYADVNEGSQDRNKECLLYADHTESSEYYNASSLSWSNGAAPENFAGWMVAWNYSSDLKVDGIVPVQREAKQGYGRPWTRMASTIDALAKFTDKDIDSRFFGTFTYAMCGNWQKGSNKDVTSITGANGLPINQNEVVLYFSDDNAGEIQYPTEGEKGDAGVGAGTLPGYACYVMGLDRVNRGCYPILWKLGPYRTDNGDGLGSPNGASTRPFVIAKYSELYLIAAEAAVKANDNAKAKQYVNVLRARAGKWNNVAYPNIYTQGLDLDASDRMVAATPETITIDYILDERLRELYGEGIRWFDLVRTQTWAARAGKYHICNDYINHTATEVARDIKPMHYLRPIPSGQIDALEGTEDELAAYQNPGY